MNNYYEDIHKQQICYLATTLKHVEHYSHNEL